jgi:NADH-quinone oxidoreductase subunit E
MGIETAYVDRIIDKHGADPRALISLLLSVQNEFSCLPREALQQVAARLGLPPVRVYQVARFYKAFTLEPRGKHVVSVCSGTACYVRGSGAIVDEVERLLNVEPGRTTADGGFSVQTENCPGSCPKAPVVTVDGRCYGHVAPPQVEALSRCPSRGITHMTTVQSVAELERWREAVVQARVATPRRVAVCGGRSCNTAESAALAAALEREVKTQNLGAEAQVVTTGCPGFCEPGPLVLVLPERILYTRVAVSDAADLIAQTIGRRRVVERLLYRDPRSGERMTRDVDVPFYKGQHRVLLKLS